MKIAFVQGDDDYGAMTFEDDFGGIEKLKAMSEGKIPCEDEDGEWRVTFHDFGEVDPKFVDWIKLEIQDYDDSKHKNFYIVP
jgi:hypothetical protein